MFIVRWSVTGGGDTFGISFHEQNPAEVLYEALLASPKMGSVSFVEETAITRELGAK